MGITYETADRVVVITIDRPEALNALDVSSMSKLRECLLRFREDERAHVAVLTGAGDRAFCTGADLKRTLPPASGFATGYFSSFEDSMERGVYTRALSVDALALHKPVIAAVNGHALGGGMEIAMACDLRIASTAATFGLTEARWATVPALGGTSRLLRAVPRASAMKMLLTGDRIEAEEAHRIGLVSDLYEPSDLVDAAVALAERIASNGPLAVRAVKEITRRADNLPLSEAVELEQVMWGLLRDTSDRIEGRRAFTEKRPPHYTGD